MAKLTKNGIETAELPEKGQRLIFDDHRDAPRGFGLRITKAGGKAFILRYKIDGRERRKTIGDWPTWSLEAARAEAREISRKVQQGEDPLEDKRRRKAAPTVADLAADWLDRYATGLKSEGAIRGYMNNDVIPAVGRMKVADVRRRDLIKVIEDKAETAPRAAAQLLLYARKMLDYATDREYIPANPLAGLKPSSVTVKGKRNALASRARKRILDADEIASFWNTATNCGMHRLSALALRMILVTGQRPGEVAGMHESEVSGRWWTIPASRRGKTETEHRVYLTDTALGILADAKAEKDRLSRRRGGEGAGYCFEATPDAPVTVSALWRAVQRHAEALGVKDAPQWGGWSPHDLRRTMRTGLSACRVQPHVAELVIGHTKQGIVAVYDQHGFEPEIQAALEVWERRLLSLVQGHDPEVGNVVTIGRTGA